MGGLLVRGHIGVVDFRVVGGFLCCVNPITVFERSNSSLTTPHGPRLWPGSNNPDPSDLTWSSLLSTPGSLAVPLQVRGR